MSFETPQPPLSRFLRQALLDAGFGWDGGKTPVLSPYLWQRPPLLTPILLNGVPLQPHIAAFTSLDADELVDVYERYILGAVRRRVLHRGGLSRWLRRELRLRPDICHMLFVPPTEGELRLGVHLHLVQFAALVAYNTASEIEESADTFVVTTECGYKFGIRGGQLVTNMRGDHAPIPVRGLESPTGRLSDIARGEPIAGQSINLFDTTRRWLELQEQRLDLDYEAFQLALSVLWWKTGAVYPESMWEITLRETSRESLCRALAEARRYRDYEQPLQALKDIFVPQFMTNQVFARRFGNPGNPPAMPLSQRVQARWDRELHELDPVRGVDEEAACSAS